MYKYILLLIVQQCLSTDYNLVQVLIFSRHNVRTPLQDVKNFTPNKWPVWDQKKGYLTPKGAIFEGYMGVYFAQWLKKQGLLVDGCPTEENFYVYANNKQRTIETGRAFVASAFPNCNVPVHHKNTTDNNFNPYIHNGTEVFKKIAQTDMEEKLQRLHFEDNLKFLDKILETDESNSCKMNKKCSLNDYTTIVNAIVKGQKPNITGSLKIGNEVSDAFLMAYYDGRPLEQVGWSHMVTSDDWIRALTLTKYYHDVIFNTKILAKDISKPLVKVIRRILKSKSGLPKITLLVGHDANICTLIDSLGFKDYVLPNQFEKTPIGSKIVIQKWYDVRNNKFLLKINYVYQSFEQLRNGTILSLDNPPQSILMELENCKIDVNGFCLWDDFIKILDDLVL